MAEYPHEWPTRKLKKQYRVFRHAYFGDRIPPVTDVTIRWNARLTANAGRCITGDTGHHIIELSPHYHHRYPEEVPATLLHEMIHLCAPGHGNEFRKWMTFLKERGESVRMHSRERAIQPVYRYLLSCSACGAELKKYQRWSKTLEGVVSSPEEWRCPHCGAVGTLRVLKYGKR